MATWEEELMMDLWEDNKGRRMRDSESPLVKWFGDMVCSESESESES